MPNPNVVRQSPTPGILPNAQESQTVQQNISNTATASQAMKTQLDTIQAEVNTISQWAPGSNH